MQIIHKGFKNYGAPLEAIKDCDKARHKDTRQYIIQNDALQKIGATLVEEHISYISLKGAVLRDFYQSPELRSSCVIDVLVKEKNLEAALAAIENTTDFTMSKRNYHDISMVNSSVHLELHLSILENMENTDKLLSQVWDYAVLDKGSRYQLTPEFQIFHVLAHMNTIFFMKVSV